MNLPPSARLLSFRAALGLVLVAAAAGAWVLAEGPSRGRDGRRSGGERGPEKKGSPPAGKRTEEEEEEKPRKPRRPVPRVEDVGEKAPAKPAEAPATDLLVAAEDVEHVMVRDLFRKLAVPHDEVTFPKSARVTVNGEPLTGRTLRVEPLPLYVSDPRDWKGEVTLHVLDAAGKRLRTVTPNVSAQSVRYYEAMAVEEVGAFLKTRYDGASFRGGRLYLTRYQQLAAAEQALAFVLRFHESARAREVRRGPGWKALEDGLREQLLTASLGLVDELAEGKRWDEAFDRVGRLAETYPADHAKVAAGAAGLLGKALADAPADKSRLLRRLRRLEELLPGRTVTGPIRESLKREAQARLDEANKLAKADRKADALVELRQAEKIYPQLPGLRAARMELDKSYQVLQVGMRELPAHLSPARACTDPELRAVEMLFEGLVKSSPDEGGVRGYRPGLAEGRVRVLDLGREFRLPRDAAWSNGGQLSGPDVRRAMLLLLKGQGTGRSAAWGELLADARMGGDPYRVKVRLQQGFLDPLAPMSFKLLPPRAPADLASEKFAEDPVGSGPFRYAGRTVDKVLGQEYVSFKANPYYGERRSKRGMPWMREVQVFAPKDPARALESGRLDLALDLTAAQAASLQKKAGFEVPLPAKEAPDRRIYFLAINHRHEALARAEVRLALARAVHREKLLDDNFRVGLGRVVHRALNGPYPAGSWACDPNPILGSRAGGGSLDPYDPDLALTKLKPALAALGGALRLTLKYPSGESALDAQLRKAMEELCAAAGKTLPGVTLVPEGVPPRQLRKDVEETRRYELAYYHYDFPDEAYWLLPLLGPLGRDGAENYLGYTGSLVGLVQASTGRRQFAQVRMYAHLIHRDFLQKEMPFVPLWQLAPFYAYRKGELQPVPFDPHLVFTDVEHWRVTHKVPQASR